MHKSESEMKQAAAFVYYEYEQFRWAISHLPKEWRCGTGGLSRDKDAVIEVALLHARVLRDFFSPLPKHCVTDIIAADFFEDPQEWSPPVLSYLENNKNKKRLNRSLAHLSYSRTDYESQNCKEWDFQATSTELTNTWKAFLAKLPEERRPWFQDDEDMLWLP